MSTWRIYSCAVLIAVCVCLSNVWADMYDLTGGPGKDQVQVGDAWFYNANAAPTGTGVIDPFVRIHKKGIEQGYNTDGRPLYYDENHSPQFTRSLLLSDVPAVDLRGDGTYYREFLLDINQQNNSKGHLLSLDEIAIYQADAGNLTGPRSVLGTPIYDLDGPKDNWLLLNYSLGHGSGSGDLLVYVPNSLFGDSTYVYLYSMFGANEEGDAGFEEWAVREGGNPPVAPVPAAALLALLGLTTAGCGLRRLA